MRARLAIRASGVSVELREILLRDKPEAFLAASAKGTVPVLATQDRVIDECRDIMLWTLAENDPDDWLAMSPEGFDLVDQNDGPFKAALDRTKYAARYPDDDPNVARETAMAFLRVLEKRLETHGGKGLCADKLTFADIAILPFVRQFANIDRAWFDAQNLNLVMNWLDRFLASSDFNAIMQKHPPWQEGQEPVVFPS